MTTDHRTTDSSGARYFDYRPGKKYWWRYLPVGVGLAFVYVVLVLNGLKPFSVFWFPAVVIVVFLDIIGVAMVRFKSPRAFRTDGEKLLIEWADGETAISLDNVSVRRCLTRLLNSGTVLKAEGRTFAVFEDLTGYSDLLSIFAKSGNSDDPS